MTRTEVNDKAKNLAKGLMNGGFCPEVEGEESGPMMRFCGIWCKNRWEWATALIACMHYNITVVGFFDAMGAAQMDFILKQTEMSTIICAPDYIPKLVQMKKDGLATFVKNIISLD